MPIDPSIPLSTYRPFDPMRAFDMAAGVLRFKQEQQQQQSQNALKAILAQPGAIDPTTGGPSQNALAQIMKVDPATGMKFQQNALALKNEQVQAQHNKLTLTEDQSKAISGVRRSALEAYDQAKKDTGSEQAAQAAGQAALDEGLGPLKSSGAFEPEKVQRFTTKFDPALFRQRESDYVQAQQERALKDKREQQGIDLQEKRLDLELKREHDTEMKGWQVLTDPKTNQQYRYNPNTGEATTLDKKPYSPGGAQKIGGGQQVEMSDDAANLVAEQVLAGNHMAMTGLARSAANIAKVNNAIAKMAKDRGMNGAEIAAKQAEFSGMMASERAVGTRTANMDIAANEVKNMAPLALSLSEKVNRTEFPTLNSIQLAAERGLGGVDVVRFAQATNALVYMYAKFLNPNGIPTDADKARATDILSTAWAKGQFKGAVDQIQQEISVGKTGLGQTKQELGDQFRSSNNPQGTKSAPKTFKYDAQGNRIAD